MVILMHWFWGSTRPQYFSEDPGATDAGFLDFIHCCQSEEWAKADPEFISCNIEYLGHLSHADSQLLNFFFSEAMSFYLVVNSVFSHKSTELISNCSLFWGSWRIFCLSCASVFLSVEWWVWLLYLPCLSFPICRTVCLHTCHNVFVSICFCLPHLTWHN